MNKKKWLMLFVFVLVGGCDVTRLLRLKEKYKNPYNELDCFVDKRGYSIFFKEELFKISDLAELGFNPDAVEGSEDSGTYFYDVYNYEDSDAKPIIRIKIETSAGYILRATFPSELSSIIPPKILMDYIEILSNSTIDPKNLKTVATSPPISLEDQADYYTRYELESIFGRPTIAKKIGINRATTIFDLRVGVSKPKALAIFAASRIAPANVDELDIVFSNYRIRTTKSSADVTGLVKEYRGNPLP